MCLFCHGICFLPRRTCSSIHSCIWFSPPRTCGIIAGILVSQRNFKHGSKIEWTARCIWRSVHGSLTNETRLQQTTKGREHRSWYLHMTYVVRKFALLNEFCFLSICMISNLGWHVFGKALLRRQSVGPRTVNLNFLVLNAHWGALPRKLSICDACWLWVYQLGSTR